MNQALFILLSFLLVFGHSAEALAVQSEFEQVNSVHLNSEIAKNSFNADISLEIPEEFDEIKKPIVSLSCSCLSAKMNRKKSTLDVKMNFGRKIESNKQQIGLIKKPKSKMWTWNCTTAADIACSTRIIRLDAAESIKNPLVLNVIVRSRKKLDEPSKATKVIEPAGLVKNWKVELKNRSYDKNKNIWIYEQRLSLHVAKSDSTIRSSKIVIYHPEFQEQRKSNPNEEWLKYLTLEIPVYVLSEDAKTYSVNFGAVKLNSTRSRKVTVEGGDVDQLILALQSKLEDPSFEFKKTSNKNEILISFTPTKKIRLSENIIVPLGKSQTADFRFKAIAYGRK